MSASSDDVNSLVPPPVTLKELSQASAALSQTEACLHLYQELMQTVCEPANSQVVLDPNLWRLVPIEELPISVSANLPKLINYAYNARYLDDNFEFIEIVREDSLNNPNTRTYAVYQPIHDQLLILGTWRIAWGSGLAAFEFFEMKPGAAWPHLQNCDTPKQTAESSRMAFHPILDPGQHSSRKLHMLTMRIKQHIFRSLWLESAQWLLAQGAEFFYMVMVSRVRSFLENSGVELLPVEGARLAQSDKMKIMYRQFSKYWCPDSPASEQPALYTAKWDLRF